jgi:predicted amidohydrolase
MALSKKMLQAMDISDEKIDQIVEAHRDTINGLTAERDQLKTEVAELAGVKEQLSKANAELAVLKEGDWETKYNTLKNEYDSFKADTETKAVKAAKTTAYRQLLLDAGISDKRIAAIMKVSDLDAVEIDKDGNIKDADAITAKVKEEWADFIVTKHEEGAKTPNPAENNGGEIEQPSRAAMMAAKFRNEHYGNPAKEV